MRDYKNIKAYQYANKLTLEIYRISKFFPKDELYGLTSQVRRAAVSIVANIAEGASRQHKKDYLNFLFNARGSIAELECLLDLVHQLGYFDPINFKKINQLRTETAKTLVGLINSVEREVNEPALT